MSKLKTPQDKKLASLALDGRNVYGENDKASRKAIPLRKKLGHQELRRASKALSALNSEIDEDGLVTAENKILSSEIAAKRKRFRKRPDQSLEKVLEAKRTGDGSILQRKRK